MAMALLHSSFDSFIDGGRESGGSLRRWENGKGQLTTHELTQLSGRRTPSRRWAYDESK